MTAGYLEPVVAEAVFDVSKFVPGIGQATKATTDLTGGLDRAGVAAAKMEAAVVQAALKVSDAQAKAAVATEKAAQAQSAAVKAGIQAADGQISLAEATAKATAAKDAQFAADRAQADASLATRRAVIAQSEAQLALADSSRVAAASQDALVGSSVAAGSKIAGTTGALATKAGVLGIAFTTLKDNWVTAAALIGIESIHLASNFDTQMERLRTQAGYTQAQVDSMKGSVLSLSGAVGQSPEKLAEALYHVASDGYKGSEALSILKLAAEGAATSGANLDDTVYTLTSTMKALGDHGIQGATKDMSILNAIVGAGDMRFQDLNSALGTGILGTISTFHISLQSLGGALDYLTQRGEPATQSATRLAMGIALLAAPSKAAAGILSALGLTNSDLANSATAAQQALSKAGVTTTKFAEDLRQPDGIAVAIKDLNDHLRASGLTADEAAATISRAFGGGRTGKAIMQLATDTAGISDAYNMVIANTGKFQGAFEATTKTLGFKWHSFLASLEADGIKLGHDLEPVVSAIFSGFDTLGKVLEPVKTGFMDVWRAGTDLQHSLQPLEHLLENVFGAVVVASIDAVGFALRDVVAPAVHGVADAFQFLDRHKEIVLGLATVIGTALLPKLTLMTADVLLDAAAWAALGLAGVVADIKNVALAIGGFIAAHPILAGTAVVLGAAAAAFVVASHDANKFTLDVQALTVAVKELNATGNEKPLASTLLDDLSKWSLGKAGKDGIAYLQQYGVSAAELVKNLADPANNKGVNDFLDSIDAFANHIGRIGSTNGALPNFQAALKSTNPAVQQLAILFQNLYKTGKPSLQTVQDLADHFKSLEATITGTEASTKDNTKAQAELNKLLQPGSALLKNQASGYISVADAQKEVKSTSQDLVAANKALAPVTKAVNDDLGKQIDFFKGVATQSDLTAQTLLKNAQDALAAYQNEIANIALLQKEGASPDLISQLFAQGPQTVQLAAQAGPGFIQQYQDLLTKVSAFKYKATQAVTGAIDPLGALQQALAKHANDQALQDAYRAALIGNWTPVANQLESLAAYTGSRLPGAVSEQVIAGKIQIIDALNKSLGGPSQAALDALENLATSGGQGMATNLANAIKNHTPLVISKAEALKLGINAQIQAILSSWGITVKVDDQATQTLAQIKQAAQDLIDNLPAGSVSGSLLANATQGGSHGAGAGRVATGGYISGAGTGTSDSIPAWLSNGEYVVNAKATSRFFPLLSAINSFAAGGVVGQTNITINEDAITTKLLGIAQAGAAGASVGGGAAPWAGDVLTVLGLLGLPVSLLPRVLSQINTESGGNPNAINLTDSNAAAGTPSKGILQTIDPTFYAYAGPYAALGPFNPFADIYAGINYAAHRYAGDPNIGLGYGHGYAKGGLVGGNSFLSTIALTGNLVGLENQRAKYNQAHFSKATAANVPGLQVAAEHAAQSSKLVGTLFADNKATLFHLAHSGSSTQRKAAGTLYGLLQSRAGQLSADANIEQGLLNTLRSRYAGQNYAPLVSGRPSQDLSYLALAGPSTAGTPASPMVHTVIQIGDRQIIDVVSKGQLKQERRSLSNGATANRNSTTGIRKIR